MWQRRSIAILLVVVHNLLLRASVQGADGQCLRGWGAIMGVHPDVVNAGLSRENTEPSHHPVLNGEVRIPFNDLPITAVVTFTDVTVGDFILTPLRNEAQVGNVRIGFSSGSIEFEFGRSNRTYDMTGAVVDIETHVISRRSTDTDGGVRFDLELHVEEFDYIRDLTIEGARRSSFILRDALEVKLKQLIGPELQKNILSFDFSDTGYETNRFIPTSMNFMFHRDQSVRRRHAFVSLMTLPNMDVPTDPRRHVFDDDQMLLPGTQLTLTVDNNVALRFVLDQMWKVDVLRHLELEVMGGCPSSINLTQTATGFSNQADLVDLRISFERDMLDVFFKATIVNASLNVNTHVEHGVSMALTYNQSGITTREVDAWTRHYPTCSGHKKNLVPGCDFWADSSDAPRPMHVIPFMKDLLARAVSEVNEVFSEFVSELQLPLGGVTLGNARSVNDNRIKTDRYGNIQFGNENIVP